MRTSLR